MKLLKTVLLSTSIMMGVTFGSESMSGIDTEQETASQAREASFLKASTAFGNNQKRVKETLLILIERHTGSPSTKVNAGSKSIDIIRELNTVMKNLVDSGKTLQSDLNAAKVQAVIDAEESARENLTLNEVLSAADIDRQMTQYQLAAAQARIKKLDDEELDFEAVMGAATQEIRSGIDAARAGGTSVGSRVLPTYPDDSLNPDDSFERAPVITPRGSVASSSPNPLAAQHSANATETNLENTGDSQDDVGRPLEPALDVAGAGATNQKKIEELKGALTAAQAIVNNGTTWTGNKNGPKNGASDAAKESWSNHLLYLSATNDVKSLTDQLKALDVDPAAAAASE